MGIGTRDESTGIFFKSEGLDNGHWYVDAEGYLYIVPDERYGSEECAGPDNDTMDKLNAVYRETEFEDIDPFTLAKQLDLEYVSPALHRYCESGFYTA